MNERDDLFRTGDSERIWQKYCGFLDLSVAEFMDIQEQLLLEEVELVADCPLGREIMGNRRPASVAEFRQMVPLTRYQDYAPYFSEKREDMLAAPPYYWTRTSGRSGSAKWVPYTSRGDKTLIDGIVAVFILGAARAKGEVKLRDGVKVIANIPPQALHRGTSRL